MNLKPFAIILFLAFCPVLVSAQFKHIRQLGTLATINFPDTPKIKHTEGTDFYITRYNNVIFFAQASEIHTGLSGLLSGNKTDSVYDGYIRGTLKGTGGQKLFYKDKITINGNEGIEFGYTAPLNGQPTFRYNHAVFLNDTLLMCGIWASDSLSKDDPGLKPFFDGFSVKTPDQLSQASAMEAGRKAGKTLAILVFIAIPVLLGLGIVFLIRKLVYKKDKKNYLPTE